MSAEIPAVTTIHCLWCRHDRPASHQMRSARRQHDWSEVYPNRRWAFFMRRIFERDCLCTTLRLNSTLAMSVYLAHSHFLSELCVMEDLNNKRANYN